MQLWPGKLSCALAPDARECGDHRPFSSQRGGTVASADAGHTSNCSFRSGRSFTPHPSVQELIFLFYLFFLLLFFLFLVL